jgi:SNF2 family DNA or RNA helicase
MDDYDIIQTVTQPDNLKVQLFKHQLATIYSMETLEREKLVEYEHGVKETRLGVNADATGYGKTLSMIGLIVRDKMEWDIETPFVQETVTTEAAGLVRNREITRYDRLSTTLILVSSSIVSQWEKEFSHTDLRVAVVATRNDVDFVKVEEYDVVIVTISMFNNLAMSYARYAWKRFIFDEPGHVRVSGMKELNAGFYWFVTATPEAITVKHRNCRGSFMKKIIGDGWLKFEEQFEGMILRNNLEFVQASFDMPQTIHYYHKCYQPVLQAVSGMVNNTIHTMIAAGNIEGAISALGGKKTKNIVELVMQEKLEEQAKVEADIHIYSMIKKDEKNLENALKQKESIDKQIEELNLRFKNMLTEKCSICMEKLKEPVMEPACQNVFCGECLLTWLQKADNCPLCRKEINTCNLIYLSLSENNKKDYNSENTKRKNQTQLEKVSDIIQNTKNGKFLIFSAYDATFDPICKLLKEQKISFTQVKGTRQARQKSIDDFKFGTTQVIFLNSDFNGAGINLQEATDIILYHEMSVSTQNQIIGRANRIGRVKSLQVHHLQVDI